MKKVLLTAVVSALLVASCSQEEVVETDDGIFKLAPEGQFVYGAATGYFDCYKNDVSGEEHYKCHFILN